MGVAIQNIGIAQDALMAQYEACMVLHHYSEKTRCNYRKAFRAFLDHFSPLLPLDLQKEQIEDWLALRGEVDGISESYRNMLITAIRFYYEVVACCDAARYALSRPKAKPQDPRVLTKEEVQAMIAGTANLKHKSLLMLTYSAGLRLGEVLNLRLKDIDLGRLSILVRGERRKKGREVPLSPKLLDTLRAYFKAYVPLTWVLEGDKAGEPYSERSAQMVVRQAAARAGIARPVTPHMLRDSYATHLLEAGTDIRYLQSLLGHNSIKTTERYTYVARRHRPGTPMDDMDI